MDRLSGHWLRFLAGTAWRVRKRSDGHRVQRVRGHQRVRLVRLSGLRVEAAAARGVEVFATISLPLSPVPSRARCLTFAPQPDRRPRAGGEVPGRVTVDDGDLDPAGAAR